jgi:hypothetical protein
MAEAGTVGKAMYSFSILVTVSAALSRRVEELFHVKVKFVHFRDAVIPFKTSVIQVNLNSNSNSDKIFQFR